MYGEIKISPDRMTVQRQIIINMTRLDEIAGTANQFREIVLNVDGEMHRYKTEDVLRILREIEL